jgi:regulator of protease activity HflC (stomatin/prohibitin superfamily)
MTELINAIQAVSKGTAIMAIIAPWEQGDYALGACAVKQVKRLNAGIHLKLPIVDTIYVQSVRMRISGLPRQTVTTKDGKTVTITGSVGYAIANIQQLYNTLHHPEDAIQKRAQALIANFISSRKAKDCTADAIEAGLAEPLRDTLSCYGIEDTRIFVTDLAIVRTYRLIGDNAWGMYGGPLNTDQPIG